MDIIRRLRIGVSPLSWTNDVLQDLGDDIPLTTCLREAAAAGYQGIELGRKFPRTRQELQPLLDVAGLQLASGWFSGFLAERDATEELAAVHDHAQLLQALGCEVMVYGECGAMPEDSPLDLPLSRSPALSQVPVAEYAARVSDFARLLRLHYGLRLAYHHHLMMLVERDGEVHDFLQACDEQVGIVLDCGHAAAAGVDIARLIERYGERIIHIHLKDVRGDILQAVLAQDMSFNQAVRQGLFTVPGEGVVDYRPVIDFLRHSAYCGWIIIEAEQDPRCAPPFMTVSRARDWIRRQIERPETC
ncbi:myo-inosose-2 dehydratase [Serratia rhizosphaerae]|uniref:myo-inosose-2 dehydratase n=1 Tax=Serratia rhizosphaerae TaxID=2597702 RepID=UPI002DB55B3D|nr:myo-inosose-2 dehydratase [Serratia rhizosphaerae]MEB6336125.1 myo-inosose-2 dehydratase [Serratia rhizosphaerae]